MWLEIVQLVGVPLIAGVVAALLTPYFTSRFSFDRFRKEQWWQEKRKAYDSIIRELSRTKFNAGAELRNLETGGALHPGKIDAEKEQLWTLREITSSGAYIVSSKTAEAVERVINLESGLFYEDLHADLSKVYDAAKDALETVRPEAHRDLGVLEE